MITAKLGRRGQFVLPRYIRRQMGLREGDRILLIPEEGHVILRRLPDTLLDLRGSISVNPAQNFKIIQNEAYLSHIEKGSTNDG
ncbi:MAG: AbrB/MazE/SpoVT family DNA-binding domain-containing protein [Anaerolineales bacterium]